MSGSFEKRYHVGADIRARVDPDLWVQRYPCAGSTDPLLIRFDKWLDQRGRVGVSSVAT